MWLLAVDRRVDRAFPETGFFLYLVIPIRYALRVELREKFILPKAVPKLLIKHVGKSSYCDVRLQLPNDRGIQNSGCTENRLCNYGV